MINTMINIQPSPFTLPEIFQPDCMVDDARWYPIGDIGKVRPLLFDTAHGGWISILRADRGGTVQRHRHSAPVTAWTMDGAWGYREHDWIARAGSFVIEPAGHIHTLYVDPVVGKMTAIFHTYGPVVYVDDEGNATGYDDVHLRLDRYATHCREVGLGDDWVRSLVR